MNEILEKLKIVKEKKIFLAVIVSVFIILLIILSSSTETTDTEYQETTVKNQITDTEKTEEQLEKIISRIDGVGNVNVMITFSSSGEFIYAENSKSENNGDKSSFDSEVVLYEAENGNNEGLVVSVKNPEISGVAVVCDGGGKIEIKAEITDLVTSLFGIGADRVYVGSNAS